ncbi:MAG: head-tail adaptor protein [Chitinophagaceae bacterium]|nr:head-tail adaptor protein [Chitinophagaceae bacterium]
MGVGQLNKVVVFKENTPSNLGAGGADSYSTLLTTRGSLKKLSGSRSLSFGELVESNSYEMITRYQDDIKDNIRMDTKIEIESRTFTINSFEKIGEKRFYYRFVLSEQVN